MTSLFRPIIEEIEKQTGKLYNNNKTSFRIVADHFVAATFIASEEIIPSNKDQGYILRRLLRRGFDHFHSRLGGAWFKPVFEQIVEQYKATDPYLVENFEKTIGVVSEEISKYTSARQKAGLYLQKKYTFAKKGGELKGTKEISPDDVFYLYSSHGLSPTQIESLGYKFDKQKFAEKMEAHQRLSKKGAEKKFRGGLADHEEKTIMGHTATHLMHQALRDMFGTKLHQSGSNITTERVRFDFNFDRKLTDEEVKMLEDAVNKKIKANLPVHFEMIPTQDAKNMGAIGLFDDTYQKTSKIYFIGGDSKNPKKAYSIEFCGGPHVPFTSEIKSFKIIKQEALGKGNRRIYAKVGNRDEK